MDIQYNDICHGCLSSDRKTRVLDEFIKNECFSQLSCYLQQNPTDLLLCWECEAVARRFAKLKLQVTKSQWVLEKGLLQPKLLSTLHTNRLYSISVLPDDSDHTKTEFSYEIIKQEICHEFEVKEELISDDFGDISVNASDDEDDKLLIELSTKKHQKEKHINGFKNKLKKHDKSRKNVKNKKLNSKKKKLKFYKEIELSRREIEEERRELALKEEFVDAMFRCELCVLIFPNADDLSDHVRIKHELNSSNYKCEICTCSFASEVSYNYHTNKHTKRYQCIICTQLFGTKRSVVKHYEMIHCQKSCMSYTDLKETSVLNGQDTDGRDSELHPSFPCEYCAKTFKWRTSLRKHIQTHQIETGQMRKPICQTCGLSFATTSNLQKHVKTSSKHQILLKMRKLQSQETPSKDQEAQLEAIRESEVRRRQLYICAQCGKRFQWRGNLLRHLSSHAARANGELVCAPCGRTFSSIATFKQHMTGSRRHVSEDAFKYMCSECGKKFANKTRLKDHVDWEHLKNYVHKCQECQKIFKSHTALYLHKQTIHRKDGAQVLCDHCGKAFPNRAKLRIHITALHTRESPYKCTVCNARFSWHSCLSRHVRRVHSQHKTSIPAK